jgi:hypothetical protein
MTDASKVISALQRSAGTLPVQPGAAPVAGDPTDCRAQIGELAKRILDEAGVNHKPEAKPAESALASDEDAERDTDPAAANFMAGKLMACKTLKALAECPGSGDGGPVSIWANFRSETRYTEQANPVGDDMRILLERPELIDGYGAAMTHAIASNFLAEEGREMAEDLARTPYEACRTDMPFKYGKAGDFDNLSAPPLDAQAQGIARPITHAPIAAPGPATQAHGASGEPDWRAHAARVLADVEQLASDALEIGETGLTSHFLLWIARDEKIEEVKESLGDPANDAGSMIDGFLSLQALFEGAGALADAPRGLKLLCEHAAKLLDEEEDVLDRHSIASSAQRRARDSAEASAA